MYGFDLLDNNLAVFCLFLNFLILVLDELPRTPAGNDIGVADDHHGRVGTVIRVDVFQGAVGCDNGQLVKQRTKGKEDLIPVSG